MTRKTFDSTWLWVAAVSLFIFGGIFAHYSEEFFLQYPLDTWRMDLDDLIGNIGTFLVGVAALIGLRRVTKRAEINGVEAAQAAQLLEKREERDYQLLRAEFEALKAHFDEWDGKTERRQREANE